SLPVMKPDGKPFSVTYGAKPWILSGSVFALRFQPTLRLTDPFRLMKSFTLRILVSVAVFHAGLQIAHAQPLRVFVRDIVVKNTDPTLNQSDTRMDTELSIAVNPMNPNEIVITGFSG